MTVRYVTCDFCQRMADYTTMTMCPVCRKTVCRVCRTPEPPKAGICAKKKPCVEVGKKG